MMIHNCSRNSIVYKDQTASESDRVSDLLNRMTLDEKIAQITMLTTRFNEIIDGSNNGTLPQEGIGSAYIGDKVEPAEINRVQKFMVENTRLGIPFLLMGESIHGLAYTGATVFPQAIGLASAFDVELMSEIADVIGKEAEIVGIRQCYAPNLDISRDPRWGRVEENYGECPYLTSRLGVSYIKALQSHHVAAAPKHYLAHGSPEGGVNTAPSHMGEREVREVMLDPFRAAVQEAKCMSLMPAYNEIDGIPLHSSSYWLKNVLRDELGFDGCVCSDHEAITLLKDEHHVVESVEEAGRVALISGVDLLEPCNHDMASKLKEAVYSGKLPMKHIDDAVANVLRIKFRLGLFEQPYALIGKEHELRSNKSLDLARRAAEESAVLLKNDGILPLANRIPKIAVIGPGADRPRLGGYTAKGSDSYAVTLRQAMISRLGEDSVLYAKGSHIAIEDDIENAVTTANQADVVVVVLCDNSSCFGSTWGDEDGNGFVSCGENYDCLSLNLPDAQKNLLRAIKSTGKPIVLILETGRPYCISEECDLSNAVIEAWYPGEQGGEALCNILFGDVNPSGKLPITFPKSVGHLPCYYNYKPTARVIRPVNLKEEIENPMALFPFGYGLSYTTFVYRNLTVKDNTISVTVENTGTRSGKETVLMFITQQVCPITPFVKRLRGFQKIFLNPGESREVIFEISDDDCSYIDQNMEKRVGSGCFTVSVGGLSAEFRK